MVSVGCLPNAVKPGSMTKAMIAKPTHGSAPAFFEALYATIRGRKVNTDCHMRLTNVHEGERVTSGSDQFPTTLSVAMIDMKVMMSEAPSSAPSTGRNESDRNSKNVSSHADLPRGPPSRAAALISASVGWRLPCISGRALMALYTVCTAPPMMI